MRLYRMPQYRLERFNSVGVDLAMLPPSTAACSTHTASIAEGGTLGRHRAVREQAFALTSGRALVQVDDDERVDLRPGVVVIWAAGELHQTWAVTDVTAVIVETEGTFTLGEDFPPVSTAS